MNDLQQARKLLEDKIALTNSLITRKKKDFDYHSKEADEIQLAIEVLIVEKWKDQESLKAVNEEISQIPTLAVQKTNSLWKTFKIGLAFLLLTSTTFGQAFIDFGGGAAKVSNNIFGALAMTAGYQTGDFIIQGEVNPELSDNATASKYLGISTGYQIGKLIPYIGYYRRLMSNDNKDLNGYNVGYSLEYYNELGEHGGYYFKIMYINNSAIASIGAKIKIF